MSLFSTKTIPPAPAAPPAARPLASAAAETTWIEAAEPFQCTSEVGLSQALYQLDSAQSLHMARTTAAVRHFTLENVVLDSDSLRLFQDGALLAETAEASPSWASEAAADPGTVPPQDDDADFILGCNPGHADHRCWLTQCLPAIDWSLRLQAGRPARLVLPPLAPWQQESLDLLGYGGIPRLTLAPGTRIRFARLHVAEFLTGAHGTAVSLSLRRTIERLMLATPPAPATETILYVPATGDAAPANQAGIIETFSTNGIRIVEPALPLAERIALFRNAHVVIGPTSSALADVVFCRAKALLWEWMPRHRLDPACNRLAQAATVDYLADVFPVAPRPETAGSEWHADPELIRQRMGQIAARLARQAAAAPSAGPAAPPARPHTPAAPPSPPSQPAANAAAHDDPIQSPEAAAPPAAAHPTPEDRPVEPSADPITPAAEPATDLVPIAAAPAETDTACTAMEFLARTATRTPAPAAAPPPQVRRSLLARLFGR